MDRRYMTPQQWTVDSGRWIVDSGRWTATYVVGRCVGHIQFDRPAADIHREGRSVQRASNLLTGGVQYWIRVDV